MALVTEESLLRPETWASVQWDHPANPDEDLRESLSSVYARRSGMRRFTSFVTNNYRPTDLAVTSEIDSEGERLIPADDYTIRIGTIIETQSASVILERSSPDSIVTGSASPIRTLWYAKIVDRDGSPVWTRTEGKKFRDKCLSGLPSSKLISATQRQGFEFRTGTWLSSTRQTGVPILRINLPFAQHVPLR
jgi:hypothetical protein